MEHFLCNPACSPSTRSSGRIAIPRITIGRAPGAPRGQTEYYRMIKTISKVGNSQGVIFEAALMELAQSHPRPHRERPNWGLPIAEA